MKKQEKGRNHLDLPLGGHFPQAQRKCSRTVWFRISLYPGKRQRDRVLIHSPIPPTVDQLSLISSSAAPAFYRSDSNWKGSQAAQVNGVSEWQGRKSGWGRNSGLLCHHCQTTPQPWSALRRPCPVRIAVSKPGKGLPQCFSFSSVSLILKNLPGFSSP